MELFGGIEAGGTKFVCGVGNDPETLREVRRFPTTTPEETLGEAIAYFRAIQAGGDTLRAVGVASFGPVDPAPGSATFGYITSTPKPGWANTDVVGTLQAALNVPLGFDTDVNGAALGEYRWGAAQSLEAVVYLTVGTGIGGGALVNGRLLHGLAHPEMGHLRVPHDLAADPFPGVCPYHGDCLEGLASGPALAARWGQRAETLPEAHPAWDLEAHYVALGVVNLILTLSPQRVILGGGVMQAVHMLPRVRREVLVLLNGYVAVPALTEAIDSYLVAPGLGDRAGVLGAIALAEQCYFSAR